MKQYKPYTLASNPTITLTIPSDAVTEVEKMLTVTDIASIEANQKKGKDPNYSKYLFYGSEYDPLTKGIKQWKEDSVISHLVVLYKAFNCLNKKEQKAARDLLVLAVARIMMREESRDPTKVQTDPLYQQINTLEDQFKQQYPLFDEEEKVSDEYMAQNGLEQRVNDPSNPNPKPTRKVQGRRLTKFKGELK